LTLIIGILCSDGVVMAADGAATLGFPGNGITVRQSVRKLNIIDGKAILGVSGAVGLGQRFAREVEKYLAAGKLNTGSGARPVDVGVAIGNLFKAHIQPELNIAQYSARMVPDAHQGAITTTLLACRVSHEYALIEFDLNGAPEVKTEELWFSSVGSGESIADPLLAFLGNVCGWRNGKRPTLSQGRFAATWVLKHAIETNPGGVADPRQLAVLSGSDRNWSARLLTDEEQGEPLQMCDDAEHALRAAIGLEVATVSSPPEPPC
jgi:20S proteasome alpha/beta subunit